MKYEDYLKEVTIWLLAFGIGLWLLFSCSPQYHFNKFQKKGGKVECKGDTVIQTVTTTIKGKDGRIDTLIEKVPYIEYNTRWEVKYKYKTVKENNDVIKYKTKWKTKEVIKTKRIEERNLWWVWLIVGIVGGFFIKRLLAPLTR